MSIGLYKHAVFSETKKYILNNKHVLQIKMDAKQTEQWSNQYFDLKQSYLKNQKIKFYLLPEEVYVEASYEYQQATQAKPIRIVVYEHFIVTLQQELQMRIKLQEKFTKRELWYFLYALSCGALQMIQIHEVSNSGEELQINPQTILLNQYGYIKLLGFFSIPFTLKSRVSYRIPESRLPLQALPQKHELCCSIALGRILASLAILKDMDKFLDIKTKDFCDAKLMEQLKKQEATLGVLFNILKLMLTQNLNERLLISQIKALLLPYEDQILSLKDFAFDREVSRKSMMQLFVSQ